MQRHRLGRADVHHLLAEPDRPSSARRAGTRIGANRLIVRDKKGLNEEPGAQMTAILGVSGAGLYIRAFAAQTIDSAQRGRLNKPGLRATGSYGLGRST
jgi:hypothetical protein